MRCSLIIILVSIALLTACGGQKKAGYVDYVIFKEANGSTVAFMTDEYEGLAAMNRRGGAPYVRIGAEYFEISMPDYDHFRPITIPRESLVKVQWAE